MNKTTPHYNIVLFEPEIPQNTGCIGRLCVSNDCTLHLIKPLGFSLEDKYLKRAGMDYWPLLKKEIYEDWTDFVNRNPDVELKFFTTKTQVAYWDTTYPDNSYLVFGRESAGLPEEFYQIYSDKLFTIPMTGEFHRSLNLACSAGIVLYEALRQASFDK